MMSFRGMLEKRFVEPDWVRVCVCVYVGGEEGGGG